MKQEMQLYSVAIFQWCSFVGILKYDNILQSPSMRLQSESVPMDVKIKLQD